jgi:hypothetical protein
MRIVSTDVTAKERVASLVWFRDRETGMIYTGDAVVLAILNSMRRAGTLQRKHVRKVR